MKQAKITNLGLIRDLFAEWELVREHFRKGDVSGFHLSLIGPDGKEFLYTGGAYKVDPQLALKATLRSSAARMQAEDEPLEPPGMVSKKH